MKPLHMEVPSMDAKSPSSRALTLRAETEHRCLQRFWVTKSKQSCGCRRRNGWNLKGHEGRLKSDGSLRKLLLLSDRQNKSV